jgi:hypothetical protein
MADYSEAISKAKEAGYSDSEIADFLSSKEPGIKTARDAGYGDGDIIGHLSGAQAPQQPAQDDNVNTAADAAKSFAVGPVKGLIGMAGAIPWAESAIKGAANKYLFDPLFNASSGPRKDAPEAPDAGSIVSGGLNDVSNQLYQPKTTAGKYAGAVGEMLPNVIGGPEALGYKLLTRAVAPGLASEAAGQATEGTALEPYARFGAAALAGGGAAAAVKKFTGTQALLPPITAADNATAATQMYSSPVINGTTIDPLVANRAGASMEQALRSKYFNRTDHGPVFNAADELKNASSPMTLNDFDTLRKRLNEAAGDLSPAGRPTSLSAAGQLAKNHLDNFVDNLSQRDVLSGNISAARNLMAEARATAGAGIRSDEARIKLGNAMWGADAANSGLNVENRIRQAFKGLVLNDGRKAAGYSPEETAALQKLVRGSKIANGLRLAGNSLGGSGGVISAGTIGAALATGNPLPLLVPATGIGLKVASNMVAKANANKLVQRLAAASPMGQQRTAFNNITSASNSIAVRNAATRGALRSAAAQLLLNRNNNGGN